MSSWLSPSGQCSLPVKHEPQLIFHHQGIKFGEFPAELASWKCRQRASSKGNLKCVPLGQLCF